MSILLQKFRYTVWSAIVIVSVALALPVYAQDVAGIKVSPALFEKQIEPGETIESSFQATNKSSGVETFDVFVRDVVGVQTGGQPIFAEEGVEKTGLEFSSWVTLSKSQVTVAPGETVTIPYTISVPVEATPGGHSGLIFLGTPGHKTAEIGLGIGFEVGTIVNLTVSGDVVDDVRIYEFSSDRYAYAKPEVKFRAKVVNKGNSLARPRGPIEITDMFGKPVGTVIMNNDGSAVLPNSERIYEVTWTDDRIRFGRYEALMSLTYGTDVKQTITSVLYFWVFPTNVLYPLLLGLLIFLAIVYLGVKLYIRKALRGVRAETARLTPAVVSRRSSVSRLSVILVVLLTAITVFLIVVFVMLA